MDQVEFALEIPINQWDRKLSPVILMERVFTVGNRKNVEIFYKELFVTVQEKESENCALLAEIFKQSEIEYENGNYPEALELLTRVIKHAGKDSKLLQDAVALRATIFAITSLYEQAIIDNELKMKELSTNNEQKLEEISKIIECYLALGCRRKVEHYLAEFTRIYDMLLGAPVRYLNGLKVRKKISNVDIQGRYKNFQSEIESQLSVMKYHRMLPVLRETIVMQPYRGFNKNIKIQHSSASCSLVVINNRQMILSNSMIPRGEIVAVESPFLRQQYGRTPNCDSCFATKNVLIPCFDCHFKNYCSYDCKIADKRWHDLECIGYKSLILPMLKCELLYRLLMQCLVLIQDHALYRPKIRKSKTAEELFENLKEVLPDLPCQLIDADDIGFDKFPESEYTQMVLNSFRLTIFISKYTTILSGFFISIEAKHSEIEIFTAGLLLQLSAKIVTSSFQINVKLNTHQIDPNTILTNTPKNCKSPREAEFNSELNIRSDVFRYYGFDRDCMKSEAALKVQDALQKYWNVDTALFEENMQNEDGMQSVVDKKEIVGKWMDVSSENDDMPSVVGLYLTTLKFNHSCDPNLRLIYLSSGIIVVKASRDIRAGEILTISYGCHYKQGDNNTRLMCTNKFNISCLCDYCNGKFNPYFAENILCINCKSLVNPTETLCVSCGNDMIKTSMVYKLLMSDLECTVNNLDEDRNMFYNLAFALMVFEEILPATNQLFLGKLVLLAEFFAKKCFAYEAYILSIEVQSLMEKIYIEMSIELLYAYNIMLLPLYEILLKYIENPIGIDGSFIENVFNRTLAAIESMIEINDFNVLYDPFTCDILNKYRIILNLKVKVYSLLLYGDAYKTIINSGNMLESHTNMNPLIKSVTGKNPNLVELKSLNNKTDNNWPLDEKSNVNILNKSLPSPQKVDSVLKSDESHDKIAAKSDFHRRINLRHNARKTKTLALMAEFDAYFMEMIEERTGALDLFLYY